MKEISTYLCKIVETLDVSFTLNGKQMRIDKVLSNTGLLPAIARRADQISTLCVGYGIGISFDEVDTATLGVKVIFDDVTTSALRFMCIIDVIMDIISFSDDKETIALDELLYD